MRKQFVDAAVQVPELHDLKDDDLQGLAPEAVAALSQQLLQRLRRHDSEIRFKDARIEKITFELARLKAWKFGTKTEAMNAWQRRLPTSPGATTPDR